MLFISPFTPRFCVVVAEATVADNRHPIIKKASALYFIVFDPFRSLKRLSLIKARTQVLLDGDI
jgi:hypothetical protein